MLSSQCTFRLLIGAAIASLSLPAHAALTYPGCPDLKPTDFTVVSLVSYATDKTIQEPIKMATDMDAAGNVDVYFTQRFGKVRKYSGAKKALVTLGDYAFSAAQVPVDRNSLGLNGIALDPDFKNNHWIYLYIGLDNDWHVSRLRLDGEKLDMTSEKIMFKFDGGGKGTTHVAGALHFDTDGNLWISSAENEQQKPSANTSSYLGKILRIKLRKPADGGAAVAPGVGSTYDVPEGNLYPAGTAKALPEIYIMGTRNPYTFALDPVRKAVAWGDIGPDGLGVTEEFNFTSKPGNFGYPGWAGVQKAVLQGYGTPTAPTFPDNTGINALQPAQAPIIPYQEACAITGPVYYFNAALNSPIKFPPHLNGAWLIGDFNYSWIDAVELDAPGSKVLSRMRLLDANAGGLLNKPTDFTMGPDGAMYIMNYSGYRTWNEKTGLLRVEYHGGCNPVSLAPQAKPSRHADMAQHRLQLNEPGLHRIVISDASGRISEKMSVMGPGPVSLRPARGLRVLEVTYPDGSSVRSLIADPRN